MGILGATMFIVGTCIGAGFVSGAELVRFFKTDGFLFPVIVSCLAFFCFLVLFLSLGKKYDGYEGATNVLFHKGAPAVRVAVVFLAFIPCAGFLAGFDALLPQYKPLLSVAGILLVSLFLEKGMKGIGVLNGVLVPVLIVFILWKGNGVAALSRFRGSGAGGYLGGVMYASMNAFLAMPVLMDAGKEMKHPKLSSALAAAIIGTCALFVLGAIVHAGVNVKEEEIPFLAVMRGNVFFYVASALAIATSLASALYPLFSVCNRFQKGKKIAARICVLLTAFLLSRLGLKGIVEYLYPVLGILGFFLLIFCIFHEYLFKEHNEKVHDCRQQTEQESGAHHKVELEHLAAVHDKVAEPRLGNDVFAHDRTDPRHADRHLQHRSKGG